MTSAAVALRVARLRLRSSSVVLFACCTAGTLIALGQCLSLLLSAQREMGTGAVPTLGDFAAYLVAGVPQPPPASTVVEPQRLLRLPFGWLAVTLLPAAMTMAVSGAASGSEGPLVSSGSRLGWWWGRCLAVAACCVGYWALLAFCCALAVTLAGGEITVGASAWLPDVAGFTRETQTPPPHPLGPFLASAALASVALALAQLAASEKWGPRVGFALAAAVVSSSVYMMAPPLLENLMMAARSSVFVVPWQVEVEQGSLQAGIDPGLSLRISAVLSLCALAAGGLCARARDYLGGVTR